MFASKQLKFDILGILLLACYLCSTTSTGGKLLRSTLVSPEYHHKRMYGV